MLLFVILRWLVLAALLVKNILGYFSHLDEESITLNVRPEKNVIARDHSKIVETRIKKFGEIIYKEDNE